MSGSHEDNGPIILGVAIATTIAAVLCVFLRLYIRTRIIRNFWWDDGLIVVALVRKLARLDVPNRLTCYLQALSVTGTVFNGISVNSGAGKHGYDLADPLTQIPNVIKWNTAYQIDNVICVNLIKISILLFVLRIPNSKKVTYLIYFVMFFMSVVNIVTVVAIASQCRPLEKLWRPTIRGHCFYQGELSRFGYGQGVVNVITDFFCTITPVFILWNVKIKRGLKFAICGLMSIGLMATASQIVRVVALNSLNAKDYTCQIRLPMLSSTAANRPNIDQIITIVISAILDQNLGIIAACIPTFQPLFRSLAQTLKAAHSKSASRKGGSTLNSHYQNLDKPTGGNTSLEAGYGKQGLPNSIQQCINSADYSAARNSGDSGYPLHSLNPVERSHD